MIRFNFAGLLFGDLLAKARGVDNATALRDGFVAGFIGPTIAGAAFAAALASRQQPSTSTGTQVASLAIPQPRVAVLLPGTGAARLKNLGTMPSFHGMQRDQAEEFATLLGLQVEIEGNGTVVWQEPGIGKRLNPNNILRLKTDD
jgi:hypothetical protein